VAYAVLISIIFRTHCFEHVARPEQLLHTLTGLIKAGGSLRLFAPRCGLPLYLSPSAGDLSIPQRLLLLAIRLISPFTGFHPTIYTCFASRHDLAITELSVSRHAPPFSKQWLINQFSKLAISLQKRT
jgi:hypothetical protein